MSSLPMISSLSIPLRQPGPKVLSLPDGPRLSTSSLTSSTAPSPSSFPPSRPPGARACAPPLPPRRVAAGSPRSRSHSSPPFQEHGQRKPSSFPPSQAREPAPAWLACARLPVEGDCARAAWHVGRGGRRRRWCKRARPEQPPRQEVRPPSMPRIRPFPRRSKPSVRSLANSSYSLAPPRVHPAPPALETAARRRGWAARAPTSCSGLLRLRQRAPQVRRTLGSLNLVASPPGARRRRACRRNRTIFCPLLLLLRREVEEGGRGNNDISPRPADWTPTCHACVVCHMRKYDKIVS